jgi:hypothetical protein
MRFGQVPIFFALRPISALKAGSADFSKTQLKKLPLTLRLRFLQARFQQKYVLVG